MQIETVNFGQIDIKKDRQLGNQTDILLIDIQRNIQIDRKTDKDSQITKEIERYIDSKTYRQKEERRRRETERRKKKKRDRNKTNRNNIDKNKYRQK